MKTPRTLQIAWFMLISGLASAQVQPKASAAIEGIKGVKQEAVESIKKVEPPTASPVMPTTVQGVQKVDGVNTINGVKTPAPNAVQPVPPPPPTATVNTINGVKAPVPNAVQPVPPPPAGSAVSTIRAVKGVEGIVVPKQRNLEAALQIKEGATPDPKGKAAAAALSGPPGKIPGPQPDGDGRAVFQELEKQTAPGS